MRCHEQDVMCLPYHPYLSWHMSDMSYKKCSTIGELHIWGFPGVCVCVSTPVSKDTTLALSFPMILYSSRGPAHGITTLASEASDVMGSSQRRLTVYLQFLESSTLCGCGFYVLLWCFS